jgi:hypothetical protein
MMLALRTREARSNHDSHSSSSAVLAATAESDVASSSGLKAVILMMRSLWSAARTCAATSRTGDGEVDADDLLGGRPVRSRSE